VSDQQGYAKLNPVITWFGDCLWAGKP